MDKKNYFRNVAKSVNYMVDDLLKTKSPATYNMKNALNSVKNAQKEIRDLNIEAQRQQRANKPVAPAADTQNIIKNAIEDAKSGRFYNKQRTDKMNDDFDKANSGSAFNLNFENALGDLNNSYSGLSNTITAQTKVSVSLARTQLVADHQNMLMTNNANKTRHLQMMDLNSTINDNIINLVEFNNSKMAPYMDQSLQYYRDSIYEQRKLNASLEELKDMYKASYNNQHDPSKVMDISAMEKIVGGGTFDFGAYYKLVNSNLKKKFTKNKPDILTPGSMHKMAASPISYLMSSMFDFFAPKEFNDALKSLEQTVSGIPSAIIGGMMNLDKNEGFNNIIDKVTTTTLGKFFNLDKAGNKDIVKGGITQWIREVFGMNQDMKYDISNYNKGPMQYNGVANRAITNVIPTLLGKIYTAVSGIKDDIIVDYDQGGILQWASDKRKDIKNREENASVSAMSDFNAEMMKMIRSINTSNETKDELMKNLGNINQWITKGNKLDYKKEGFANDLVNGIAGMTPEQANVFVSFFKAMPTSLMNKLPFSQQMSQISRSHLSRMLEANADSNGLVMLEALAGLTKETDITKRILDLDYTGKKKSAFLEAKEKLDKSRKDMGVGFEDEVISARNKMEETQLSVLKSIRHILVQGLIVYPVKKIPDSIKSRSKEYSFGDIVRNANDVLREDAAIKARTSEEAINQPQDDLNDPEIGKIVASRVEVSKAIKDPTSAVEEMRTKTPKVSFLSKLVNAPYNAAAYMIHGFNKIVNRLIYGNDDGDPKNPLSKWFKEKKENIKNRIKTKFEKTKDKFLESDLGKKYTDTKEKIKNWFTKPDEEGNNFASYWSDLWGKTKETASGILDKTKEYGSSFLEEFKQGNTKLQKFLFGDDEKEGLIHSDLKNMWSQLGFDTKKIGNVVGGASAGYLASLFLPGGPLLWTMIGAGDRFVAASDGLKEMLFGTPDNPSKFFSPDLIKAFPDIKKGTGMGIVGGLLLNSFIPGGPVTASIVGGITGAIGGYLKNQNLLQKILFGNKEKGSKGIFTKVGDLIYDHIGAPIKGWFMKQSALWTRTITKHLLTPIKYALKPIGMAFTKFAKGLAGGLMNMLNKTTGGAAGWITKQIGKLGSAMFGLARGALMAVPSFASAKARGAVNLVGKGVSAVGHAASWYAMDADQRKEHWDEYKAELAKADERYKNSMDNRKDFLDEHKQNMKDGVKLSDIQRAEQEAAKVKQEEAKATWDVIRSLEQLQEAISVVRGEAIAPAVAKPTGSILADRSNIIEDAVVEDDSDLIHINIPDPKAKKASETAEVVAKPTSNILLPRPESEEEKPVQLLDSAMPLKAGSSYGNKKASKTISIGSMTNESAITEDTTDKNGKDSITEKVQTTLERSGDGADDNILGSSDFEDKYVGKDVRQQLEQKAQNDDNDSLNAIEESTSMTAKILAKFTNGDSKDGKKNTLWDFIKNLGGSLLSGLGNIASGFFKWAPLIAGGVYAFQNIMPYFNGEKGLSDIPGDIAGALSHSGGLELLRRGEKLAGGVLKTGKKVINTGAKIGSKAINLVTGGKIGAIDDLAKGGKTATGMVANVVDAKVGNVANKVVSMLDDGLKHLCGNKQIGKFIEPVYKVAKKIFPKIGAKIAKMGATAAAKVAARTASKATVIAEAALMVNDAVTGFMDYKNILGIPHDTAWDNQMAAVCAVVRFISGFCFGLIPEKWVSELILNLLGRGDALEDLQNEYNQNMQEAGFGDNAEAYAKYENPTFWQKVGSALGLSDSRKEIIEEEINSIKLQMSELDPDSAEYKQLQERMDLLLKTYDETTNTWYETMGNFFDNCLIKPVKKITDIIGSWIQPIVNELNEYENNRYNDLVNTDPEDPEYTEKQTMAMDELYNAYTEAVEKAKEDSPYYNESIKEAIKRIESAMFGENGIGANQDVLRDFLVANYDSVAAWAAAESPDATIQTLDQLKNLVTGDEMKNPLDENGSGNYAPNVTQRPDGTYNKGGNTTNPKSVSEMVQINKEPVDVPKNLSITSAAIENAGAALSLDGEEALGTSYKANTKNVYQPINDYKYISSPYGNRDWDGDGKVDEFHDGLDYAAPAGTPIYAVKSGKAYYVRGDGGYNGGWGNHIRIRHNDGYETIYAHASKVNIKEGDTVSGGQKIAEVGTTGRSTGNHLHFSLYKQTTDGSRPKYGTGINPKSYLSGAVKSDGSIAAPTQDDINNTTFDAGATEVPDSATLNTSGTGEDNGNVLEQLAAEFSNFFKSVFSGNKYIPLSQQESEDKSSTPSSSGTPSSSAGANLTIDDKSGLVDFAKLGSKKENFLEKIQEGAVATYQKYKVLPSLTLSQAVHESGWGTSGLAVQGNALFGIKPGSNWTGKVYTGNTTEYFDGVNPTHITDSFRAYNNWNESIEDHGKFLAQNSRYSEVIKAKNYKAATRAVQDAGYATDPNYASLLNDTIEYNGLDVLDKYYVKGGVGTEPISAEEYQKLNKDEVLTPKKGTLNKIDIKPRKTTDQLMLGDEDLGNGLRLQNGVVKNAGGALAESMDETLHSIESSLNRYYSDMTNTINTTTATDSIVKEKQGSGIDFAELMKAVKEIVVNTASTAANVSGLGTVVSQGIDSLAETVAAQGAQQTATTAAAVQAAGSASNNAVNVFNGSIDASRQQVSNSMRDRVKRITKGN